MATFHGPMTGLVLQDADSSGPKGSVAPGVVWAKSERDHDETEPARRGKVQVDGDAADRFRKVADLYGFTEDGGAPAAKPAPPTTPAE